MPARLTTQPRQEHFEPAVRNEVDAHADRLGKKEPCPNFSFGQGSNESSSVDPRGFEPLTPCMPCRCATGLRHGPRLLPLR